MKGIVTLLTGKFSFNSKKAGRITTMLIMDENYRKIEGRVEEDHRAIAFQDFHQWKRNLGADHSSVACQDIRVTTTTPLSNLMKNSVQIIHSPSYNVEHAPLHKDVSLPQNVQPFVLPVAGNNNIKDRTILAFWGGLTNSYIRYTLVCAWESDSEPDKHGNRTESTSIKGHQVYLEKLYKSKFCIYPAGTWLNVLVPGLV